MEGALAAESEVISVITHDLKTPLTVIKLYADIVSQQGGDFDPATAVRQLAIISTEAERAGRMLANIADLHAMKVGGISWRDAAVDVVELVASCVRPFEAWCQAKGVSLSYMAEMDTLLMVIDRDRLARVISGLLANALRYTEVGGIGVRLAKAVLAEGEVVSVVVTDNGPGMSAERWRKMVSTEAVAVALSGDIGLGFARCVLEHYQGRIWAEHNAGTGLSLHLELPVRADMSGAGKNR